MLALMTLAYTSSFMDRTILSIVQSPIKHEFQLSDTRLGCLAGSQSVNTDAGFNRKQLFVPERLESASPQSAHYRPRRTDIFQ